MNNPGLFQARWNLGRLAVCNLLPLALLGFWLWPTGQMLCVMFDEWLFHLLNSPLATHPTWLHIWAVASLRPLDAVVGVILLSLLIRGDWVFNAADVRRAFFGFVSILAPLFMMPRLVAGAHWGQDDYVGGVLLAVWALGWGYYTPYAAKASDALLRLTEPLFNLLGRMPFLSRLSVMRLS